MDKFAISGELLFISKLMSSRTDAEKLFIVIPFALLIPLIILIAELFDVVPLYIILLGVNLILGKLYLFDLLIIISRIPPNNVFAFALAYAVSTEFAANLFT